MTISVSFIYPLFDLYTFPIIQHLCVIVIVNAFTPSHRSAKNPSYAFHPFGWKHLQLDCGSIVTEHETSSRINPDVIRERREGTMYIAGRRAMHVP